MTNPTSSEPSIFSKIVAGEIPAKIRYQDDLFLAFDDIAPKAPVHVLLITKKEYPTLEAMPADNETLHAQLLLTARKIAQQLGIADNYKLHLNVGKQVQAVPHLHMHILGGWQLASPEETVAL